MDVRVEMFRILLGCMNIPDLTMHFRMILELVLNGFSFGFDNDRTGLIMI